jgi:hypothetical protein
LRGVQFRITRLAFGVSISALSPQLRLPSKGPLPVATRRFPDPGATTTPDRAQIAESLFGQFRGFNSRCTFEQSEFQTWTMRPLDARIATTCPW